MSTTGKKLLWIAFVWPEPGSSAAGFRTMQLIEALRAAGWQPHVCSPCLPNEHRERLEAMGVATAHFEPNDSRFDAFVRELDPALVVFDRFMLEEQFGWRVREQCPRALRLLDTIDLHALRRARQKRVEKGADALGLSNAELRTDDAIREVSAIYRSDLSLVVSDFEQELLAREFGVPVELVALCRFWYDRDRIGPGAEFDRRVDFVTIGNFRHAPNLDSYRLLQRGLWRKIRDRLEGQQGIKAELHVYGAYPCKELMDLDDPGSGFRVKGWAKDALETVGRYRVALAPLRFGAGIKGKISDAWAAGTPCVTTSIGAEGMTDGLPFGGAVTDDWDEFARAAVELYANERLWLQARDAGSALMRRVYDRAEISATLVERIERLLEELEEARARNFVGAMLWHHGARSTEYFSRWIEGKKKALV